MGTPGMDIRAILMGLAFAVMWSSAFTSARIIVADASPLAALTLPSTTSAGAVRGFSCDRCPVPKFQGKEFYLPFCTEDEEGNKVTHPNVCEAICVEKAKFSKGKDDY